MVAEGVMSHPILTLCSNHSVLVGDDVQFLTILLLSPIPYHHVFAFLITSHGPLLSRNK